MTEAPPTSSALAPAPPVRLPIARPPAERRERRRAVEAMLLEGRSMLEVLDTVSARFVVSRRTVRSDARMIERRWARDDARSLDVRRSSCLRRAERIATKAEAAGDYTAAVAATNLLARLHGLVATSATAQIHVDARSVNVGAGGEMRPTMDSIRAALALLVESTAPPESPRRIVEAVEVPIGAEGGPRE